MKAGQSIVSAIRGRVKVRAISRLDAIKKALDDERETVNSGESLSIEINCGAGDQAQRFTVAVRRINHYEYAEDNPDRFPP